MKIRKNSLRYFAAWDLFQRSHIGIANVSHGEHNALAKTSETQNNFEYGQNTTIEDNIAFSGRRSAKKSETFKLTLKSQKC